MYKKLLITFILLVASILSCTLCFANDAGTMGQDASNAVKNVVGGAENAVKDAANGISNGSQNITRDMENGAKNVTESTVIKTENVTQGTMNTAYNATRTATDIDAGGTTTFMGMNATSWTWLIMGIAAIAIVALVWYYGSQVRTSNFDDNDQY